MMTIVCLCGVSAFVGFLLGFLVAAMCQSAARADDCSERVQAMRERKQS